MPDAKAVKVTEAPSDWRKQVNFACQGGSANGAFSTSTPLAVDDTFQIQPAEHSVTAGNH
ncbi:MAG: hypothetical protein GC186_17880 [Rhodobacteraceae bacterium]|nr:hypothetical protein [Paracoccaceae bacterium]